MNLPDDVYRAIRKAFVHHSSAGNSHTFLYQDESLVVRDDGYWVFSIDGVPRRSGSGFDSLHKFLNL